MTEKFDVAVVGGGVVGLAHAWMAAVRGLRVVLLERSPVARGASVRNFGMIWPVGQPAGELHSVALRSRELWLELRSHGVVDVEECGSIHLAHHQDALSVLEEFLGQGTHPVRMLTPAEVSRHAPLANSAGLLGGMLSSTELRVDPRTASSRIAAWLASNLDVRCHFDTFVTRIEGQEILAADGRKWEAQSILVCSGSDLRTLFADVLRDSGLQLCKLQMLRTVAQPRAIGRAPHIASGLTLRHYKSFETCPSLPRLRSRVAAESPELDRYGIHVMASTFPDGEVVLGDSHEYGFNVSPFDNAEIDELILRELRKLIRLENWAIRERWHGVYAKHVDLPVYEVEVDDFVRVFVGMGGAGMTLAMGLADRAWNRWKGGTT